MEFLFQKAAEIGARHQRDGIEPVALESPAKRRKTCRQHQSLPDRHHRMERPLRDMRAAMVRGAKTPRTAFRSGVTV